MSGAITARSTKMVKWSTGAGSERTHPASISGLPTCLECASPWRQGHTRYGSASSCRSWAMKSSWPTCASCGRSRTVIARATRWMPRSWLAFARLDPKILRPIAHRTVAQREALTLIRARNLIVRLRTAAVNAVRGLAKPCGYRLPASSTLCFAQRCVAVLPPGLARALGPVLQQIADMTVKIKEYDRAVKQLIETEYCETQALVKVYGVGQLTALTYVLTLGSKERFQRSRDVGCYLGLRPRRSESGNRDPQLGITKAGNIYLRSLLVECANHVLGRHGKDSTLRQWGLHLASRGGKQSHNRAIVAVARKLAVLLHRIWVTQEPYIPFYAVAA